MGLSDRDYMQEQYPNVFAKRKLSKSHPVRYTFLMILTWTTILFLLYQSFLWLESYKQASSSNKVGSPEKTSTTNSRRDVPSSNDRNDQNVPNESEPANPDMRTVTKCLLNGQVTFTDRKCPSGSIKSSVTVNTANMGTVTPPTFIPTAPPIQQQVVVQQQSAQTNNVSSMHGAECILLKQQIDQIDALARQPLSGQSQDELSAERKKIRSRQFALHC